MPRPWSIFRQLATPTDGTPTELPRGITASPRAYGTFVPNAQSQFRGGQEVWESLIPQNRSTFELPSHAFPIRRSSDVKLAEAGNRRLLFKYI